MAQEPSPALLGVIRVIDRFTDSTGLIISLLAIPLVAAVGYEVIARYVFHAPTTWAYDLTYMLYGGLFMLGAAYALHKGAHVRTDFFWDKFSTRTKGIIDTTSYIIFFFPALIILGYIGLHEAIYSFNLGEEFDQNSVAAVALAIQGDHSDCLPVAADPGHLGAHQKHLCRSHGH